MVGLDHAIIKILGLLMNSSINNLNSSTESLSYIWLWLGIGLIFAIVGALQFLGSDEQARLLKEGGLFETLTVVGYFVCLILIFVFWTRQRIVAQWYFSSLIAIFLLRELDYDKIYFTVGLLKARQYTGGSVPLPELLLSILIVSAILIVLFLIVTREARGFADGVVAYKLSSLAILMSLILVFLTKTLDGLPQKLFSLGFDVTQSFRELAFACEEIGEMGIPIMFAIAIISSRSNS